MGSKTKPLTFLYKNWKGETRQRTVEPVKIWFGSTEYHKEEQWLLKAYDIEKREHRDFALNDVIFWGDKPVTPSLSLTPNGDNVTAYWISSTGEHMKCEGIVTSPYTVEWGKVEPFLP